MNATRRDPGPRRGRHRVRWLPPVLLAVVFLGTGCTGEQGGPVVVQPGAPGQGGEVLDEGPPPFAEQPHTEADVRFVRDMIAHHAQALRMADVVPDRTAREDIALLAHRIEISQEAEIELMEGWLEQRGEAARPGHHHHGDGLMPGMLTEDQFTDLAEVTGEAFDRLFLELMIYHHEGAVIMVEQLRSGGGAQEPELAQLTNHIDIDQRIEIDRMRRLLTELTQE
jgi:uncharacterized protein (DUF305 family)